MRLFAALLLVTVVSFLVVASTAEASIDGSYSDGQLTVDLAQSGQALTGTFSLGSQQFPASGHVNGNNLDGSFNSGGNSFPFTAALDQDTLALKTGGKTYTLKRVASASNPLGQGASGAAGAAGDGLPAGYSVVKSTDYGKAVFAQKSDATSVTAALNSAIKDLAAYFDGRPAVKGAYEDSKTHQSGGAVFTAALKSQPMKGVISCKLLDKGAAVTVIYCKADAPQAEWSKLASEPDAPAQSNSAQSNAAPAAAADPAAALGADAQVYQFADGTGSLTLAPGWKTQAQSAISPIIIKGPANQTIFIGNVATVYLPGSSMAQTMQRNQQRMQQMGRPSAPLFIAQFTDPLQAIQDLTPQMSQASQSRGGPAVQIDEIISHQDIPTSLPNAKAAAIALKLTRTVNGQTGQYRSSQRVQISQFSQQAWTYSTNGCTAPIDTFMQDRAVMFAMMGSMKINQDAVSQKLQQISNADSAMLKQQAQSLNAQLQANHDAWQQQQDQRIADGQAQHDAQEAGYAQHNQQFQQDELQKARNKDNQVEQILGYRTVYDTQTGLSTTVDLNDVNGVVNSLNQAALDPNRFVQIPLRDEQDPIPGN